MFALLKSGRLGFRVRVLEVRNSYGNTDLLVTPMDGDGAQEWRRVGINLRLLESVRGNMPEGLEDDGSIAIDTDGELV